MAIAVIRTASADDAQALGSVHVRAWQRAYRGLMPAAYLDALSPATRAEQWRERLRGRPSARSTVYVIENGDTVAGFIAVGPHGGDAGETTGEVYVLNVDPEAWHRGYGRALLDAGVGALRESGFAEAVLWVHPGNDRARRFYESQAWLADQRERRETVHGIEVPEIRYRRRLDTRG